MHEVLPGELQTRDQVFLHMEKTHQEGRKEGYEKGVTAAIGLMAKLFGKIEGLEDWQIDEIEEEIGKIEKEKGETSEEAELAREILIAIKNSGK